MYLSDSQVLLKTLSCLSALSLSLTGLVQRCVIIQKDENGFGLTVSGDNPVFVQLVREGEAHNLHFANMKGKKRKVVLQWQPLFNAVIWEIWLWVSCHGSLL